MQYLENEIRQITEWVWASILERDIQPGHCSSRPPRAENALVGYVHLIGDWDGAVTFQCSALLAQQIAAIMFDVPEHAATIEQTQDALGEIVNMVGGNIKSLLPAASRLSLPTVTAETDYSGFLPGGRVVSAIDFEYQGEPFAVVLLKKEGR